MKREYLLTIGGKPHFVGKYVKLLSAYSDYNGEGEFHHILPAALFPQFKKDKNNLIKLPHRVHYIAHVCLALALPDTCMVKALMILRRNGHRVNSHLFAKMRKKYAARLSEENRGANNPMYGKKKSQAAKDATSDSLLKFYEDKRKEDPELKQFFAKRNAGVKRGEHHHCYGKSLTNKLTSDQERKRVEAFTRTSREQMPWEKPRWTPDRDNWWCWAAHIHYHILKGKTKGEAIKEVFGSNSSGIWAKVNPIIRRLDNGWDPLTCDKWLERYGVEFQ
ncbi:putative NUMOD3 motif family protein [Shigella phage ChubbyThor]|nr:putative NUMOD3 motif family protein [Shigella phage ChubbyThor]